jgi:predicted metal-dependent hydrolase
MTSDLPADSIMVWSQDLFLTPRLQDVARRMGFEIALVESPSQLGAEGDPPQRTVPLTEPLEGPDARLIESLTTHRPALILVDTTAADLPWARWIHVIKTSAATRRIPILAFGPHVDAERLDQARQAGADKVVTRGRLHSSLPKLIERWAAPTPIEDLALACEGSLSPSAAEGVRHHDAGSYFEAHEWLEKAWKDAAEQEGYLYRAMLQVSVAHYHIQGGNYRGASKLMLRIRQWLDPLPDECRGVDVRRLRAQVDELRRALADLEPDTIDQFDMSLLRPIPRVGKP